MRSPAFLAEVINSQAKLVRHDRALDLPDRPALEAFARTERPAEIVRGDDGALLRIGGGGDLALGALAEEAEWILGQPAIVVQQLLARYPHRTDEALRALVETLARAGLVVAYQPEL